MALMEEPKIGKLVVLTGASGAGKDSVLAGILENPNIKSLNIKRVVTCCDRPPRPGEVDGKDYHFVTPTKLLEMEQNGELVETITQTGSSNKATPKSEIARLLKGEDLLWRIDPSRAAEISSHQFFQKLFPEFSTILDPHTIVLSIIAPKNEIEKRRMGRDGANYNPNEYVARDEQELPYLKVLSEHAVNINNLDGKLKEAVSLASQKIIDFFNDKN